MLEQLSIRNIGLVSQAIINFKNGYTTFTGETGAGKSMVLSSLLLLFGSKAHANIIRHGEEYAQVSSQWNIRGMDELRNWLVDNALDADDDALVLRCALRKEKKKQCFIQDTLVSSARLSECMEFLCEIHAQHEHQALFKESEQRALLDTFAGVVKLRDGFSKKLTEYKKKKAHWQQLRDNETEHARRMEELRFAVGEIEAAKIKPGEDTRVGDELARRANAQKITELLNTIEQCARGSEEGNENEAAVLKLFGCIHDALDGLKTYSTHISSAQDRLESLRVDFTDAVDEVLAMRAGEYEQRGQSVAELEERLAEIELVKKKYGGTIESVLEFLTESREQLDAETKFSQSKDSLFAELKTESAALMKTAEELHGHRAQAADGFAREVNEVLRTLAMPAADFRVETLDIPPRERKLASWGYDTVRFIIRSNKGELHKPIASVASGGELSRMMLAICMVGKRGGNTTMKTQYTQMRKTLVLDEIDAGIGGKTAVQVASYLAGLGRSMQIISITHIPVIASAALYHYYVDKIEQFGRTFVKVEKLNNSARLCELARMLVGDERDELAQNQAKQMMLSFRKK